MINGFIFQRSTQEKYVGAEGDNWYLNDIYRDTFGRYYDENIDKSWRDSDFVDVCSDIGHIRCYIRTSKIEKIDFRILLCDTDRKYPFLRCTIFAQLRPLGFDYAYPGGSYYSAVYNDVYSKRVPAFDKYCLNDNGLFDDLDSINIFIKHRKQMEQDNCSLELESGDFIIYKLYELLL